MRARYMCVCCYTYFRLFADYMCHGTRTDRVDWIDVKCEWMPCRHIVCALFSIIITRAPHTQTYSTHTLSPSTTLIRIGGKATENDGHGNNAAGVYSRLRNFNIAFDLFLFSAFANSIDVCVTKLLSEFVDCVDDAVDVVFAEMEDRRCSLFCRILSTDWQTNVSRWWLGIATTINTQRRACNHRWTGNGFT